MFFKIFLERVANVLGRDFFVTIISFFTTTYLANSLGAEVFGLWVGCLTFLLICDLIFRLKIDQLVIYYSKKYPLNKNMYVKIALLNLYLVVFGGILIIFFNQYVINFFSFNDLIFLALIYMIFFISVFGNIIFYIFLSESNYRAYNFCILTQAIVNATSILILFQIYDKSLFLPLISLFLSWTSVLTFFIINRLYYSNDKNLLNTPIDLSNMEILKKGSYIYLSSGVKSMSEQIPRLFAINFLGAAYVGYLGITQIIVGLLNRLPIAINTVLFPMLIREGSDELNKTLAVIRMLLIIFIPILVILEVCIPTLIYYLYGAEYSPSSSYIQILLPFMYLGLPGLVLTSYYGSKGMFKTLFKINCTAVASSVLTLFLVGLISTDMAPIISLGVALLVITISSILNIKEKIFFKDFLPSNDDLMVFINFAKSIFANKY